MNAMLCLLKTKGLQRQFRHIVSHQLYVNCRHHKQAITIKHLINDNPIVDQVDSLLLSVWKMFHYSPKKFATLQEIQATYGLPKLRRIHASATRWLSHGRACIGLWTDILLT
ncbi:uncharacterized protein LOC127867223 [Dreissena polymorpha]|uniref:uncharacterized protein LOC127867223 n=1 Tax=Dreissena polymorpha TaxID=45954 RepID=UPI0022654586|nr:uncharacterized protein LOC127867223 [Dreissena polymorpha]